MTIFGLCSLKDSTYNELILHSSGDVSGMIGATVSCILRVSPETMVQIGTSGGIRTYEKWQRVRMSLADDFMAKRQESIVREQARLEAEQKTRQYVKPVTDKIFNSEHFEYYTNGENRINELERLYKRLVDTVLAPFETGLSPIFGKKIKYHGGGISGRYAHMETAEIVEENNAANSHEIIHVLLHKYPHVPAFAEGIAECFQEPGNRLPLIQGNVNLMCADALKSGKNISVVEEIRTFNQTRNYYIPASFIYYHFYLMPQESKENFIKFLKAQTRENINSPKYDVFESYKTFMKADMAQTEAEWLKWVKTLTPKSKVYVAWN
jgi:hypothetical protein